VFLFDEPLSNLDAALRVTTRNELIKQQHEIGTTSIYVTHDQVEAMTMGHRICIMNDGKVVQIGRPLEIYRNPVDTFVAKFLGNPPMNLLPGRLSVQDGRAVVHFGSGILGLPMRITTALGQYVGRDVIVGIRPEDLYETTSAGGAPEIARLPARVVAVEPLGAETLLVVAVSASDDELIARIGRDTTLRSGDRVEIGLDTAAIHLFDPVTTKAIV
jgi:multiple sugar transport system ATP-binding protein